MPRGGSIDSQPVQNASSRTLIVSVLAFASIAVALTLLLRPGTSFATMAVAANFYFANRLLRPVLCGAAGLIIFLLLCASLQLVRLVIRSFGRRLDATRQHTNVQDFVRSAELLHITGPIAEKAFHLLCELVPSQSSLDLHQELRSHLGLSEAEILALLDTLPKRCERAKIPAEIAIIVSVYDLLHHVESAPIWTFVEMDPRKVSIVPLPAHSVSPLADLKNASPRDSRFRTRAHFSGQKRRASDYSGPFRRATDRRADQNYTGPLRRVSDRKDTEAPVLHGESSERRTDDRRTDDRRTDDRHTGPELKIAASQMQDVSGGARQHKAASSDLRLPAADPATAKDPGKQKDQRNKDLFDRDHDLRTEHIAHPAAQPPVHPSAPTMQQH